MCYWQHVNNSNFKIDIQDIIFVPAIRLYHLIPGHCGKTGLNDTIISSFTSKKTRPKVLQSNLKYIKNFNQDL